MTHILDAPKEIADVLAAAGVRATIDPRNAHPPAALVELGETTRDRYCGIVSTLTVSLVSPGPGNLDAIHALDKLAQTVMTALDDAGLPWTSGRMAAYQSPQTGETLPAYQLTIDHTTDS